MTMFRFLIAKRPFSPIGFHAGGYTPSFVATNDRRLLDTDTVAASTSLTTARAFYSAHADSVLGIFSGGAPNFSSYLTSTEKINFSTGSKASGGSLTLGKRGQGAHSFANGTAIMPGGYNGAVLSSNDKYAYSTDTYTSTTALDVARNGLGSAGNADFGLFGGGQNSSSVNIKTTSKWFVATETSSSATDIISARSGVSGAANQSFGLFSGGDSFATSVDKYQYSNDTVASGTALSTGRVNISAASTKEKAFYGGGQTSVSSTDVYNFSTDGRTSGTALTQARQGLAACSNAQAHL